MSRKRCYESNVDSIGDTPMIRINRLEVTGTPDKPDEPVKVRIELSTFAAPAESGKS